MAETHVRVVERWCDNPVQGYKAEEDVDDAPPWNEKRRDDEGDLRPIESDETHAEPARDAEELVDDGVAWVRGELAGWSLV